MARSIWLFIALALIIGACSSPSLVSRGPGLKPETERKAAPNFSLKDADGRTVQLADYRGKVVLLNFWATWCGPCKMEIPWFVEFERKHRDQGFEVIGVSMDDDGWNSVKPFIADMGINYRILMGNDSIAQLYGGVDSIPVTFVIDRAGRIAAVHVGLVSKNAYERDLEQIINSPPSAGVSGGNQPVAVARTR